tara:strand:+ start:3132 stop:3944 length:813 start_codon:yes stop_codon:yes gene_type:complete
MTPLAQRVLRRLIGDKKDEHASRWDRNYYKLDIIGALKKAQFFEITELIPHMNYAVDGAEYSVVDSMIENTFLPAPVTWIEGHDGETRSATLLIENDEENSASVYVFYDWGCSLVGTMALHDAASYDLVRVEDLRGFGLKTDSIDQEFWEMAKGAIADAYVTLAFINTPRIVGRKQHMPHKGLQKRLLSRRRSLGHFPLHGWTEIKLEITPHPKDLSDQESKEAHLTGERALHYCRAHLRLKGGKIEYVRGHWRGDASLGIKRSRYILAA